MCLCTKKKPSLVKIALGLGLAAFGYVCACAISDLIKEWPIDPNDEKPEVDEDGMTSDAANDVTNANEEDTPEMEVPVDAGITTDETEEVVDPADDDGSVEDGIVVYGTPNGKTYHVKRDCLSLSRAKSVVEMAMDDAVESGRTPCGRCAK